MSEDVSRRKMLSMLGLGAALGLTLSATLEPLEAEAQELHRLHPLPPGLTGCNDGQRGALLAISAGTHAAPVNLRPPPHQLRSNSARAGRAKQKGRGEHGFLVRECSSVRETKVYGITASEKSPPSAGGWDSRRAVER